MHTFKIVHRAVGGVKLTALWVGDGVKFVVSIETTKYSADIVKSIAEEDGWVILTQSEN